MVTTPVTCCDPCVGIGGFVLIHFFRPCPALPKPMNQLDALTTVVADTGDFQPAGSSSRKIATTNPS
jgi:hypothetical protein